jgi:hypothetical protein
MTTNGPRGSIKDPQFRHERAKHAAAVSWQNTEDPAKRTAPAREALRSKFSSDEERSEFYRRMAMASAAVRRRKAAERRAAEVQA